MSPGKIKTATILSLIIVMLIPVASAGGLLWDDLYQDNLLVTSAWFGNDLVTFFVAAPLTFLQPGKLLGGHGANP